MLLKKIIYFIELTHCKVEIPLGTEMFTEEYYIQYISAELADCF
jgi:hypothetical protein